MWKRISLQRQNGKPMGKKTWRLLSNRSCVGKRLLSFEIVRTQLTAVSKDYIFENIADDHVEVGNSIKKP